MILYRLLFLFKISSFIISYKNKIPDVVQYLTKKKNQPGFPIFILCYSCKIQSRDRMFEFSRVETNKTRIFLYSNFICDYIYKFRKSWNDQNTRHTFISNPIQHILKGYNFCKGKKYLQRFVGRKFAKYGSFVFLET